MASVPNSPPIIKSSARPIIDCYVRNSTALQVDNWRAEYQKAELPRIVHEHGYEAQVWEEQGESGETLEARSKMLAILDRIRAKESIGIATVDFGRLSRDVDMVDGLRIWETCKRAGAIIITPGKVWRPGTSQDDDFAFITFWYESRNKRDVVQKLNDGLIKRAEYAPMFRGHVPYGYDKVVIDYDGPKGKIRQRVEWKINPDERDVCLEIAAMYPRTGLHRIRNYLNAKAQTDPKYRWNLKQRRIAHPVKDPDVWNDESIWRILSRPIYRGYYPVFDKRRSPLLRGAPLITHRVPHLQIFSDEIAARIDAVKKARHWERGGRVVANSPFARLLRCPHCNAFLVRVPGASEINEHGWGWRYYYDCGNNWYYGKTKCIGGRLSMDAIFDAVIPLVQRQLDELSEAEREARAARLVSTTDDRLRGLRAEEENLRKAIADYTHDYYVSKKLPVPESIFLETLASWRAQLVELETQIRTTEQERHDKPSPEILRDLQALREDLGGILRQEAAPAVNAILRSLFREIILVRGDTPVTGRPYRWPAIVRGVTSVMSPFDPYSP